MLKDFFTLCKVFSPIHKNQQSSNISVGNVRASVLFFMSYGHRATLSTKRKVKRKWWQSVGKEIWAFPSTSSHPNPTLPGCQGRFDSEMPRVFVIECANKIGADSSTQFIIRSLTYKQQCYDNTIIQI